MPKAAAAKALDPSYFDGVSPRFGRPITYNVFTGYTWVKPMLKSIGTGVLYGIAVTQMLLWSFSDWYVNCLWLQTFGLDWGKGNLWLGVYRAGPLWCPHSVLLKYDWLHANLFDFPRNGVPLRMFDFPPACLTQPAHQVAYTKIVFQTIPYLIQCVQVRMNLETWLKEWEQSSPWIPVRKPISRESNTINQRF